MNQRQARLSYIRNKNFLRRQAQMTDHVIDIGALQAILKELCQPYDYGTCDGDYECVGVSQTKKKAPEGA